jgi:uncharacterized integral membrane protein (TIGR00697 family)
MRLSMPTLDEKNLRKIVIALSIYLVSLFASNTLGLKIMPFFFGLHLSVSIFYFPFVFLMTDVIGEVYGKRIAKFFVLAGFVSTMLFVLYSIISLAAPWSAAGMWAHDGYNLIFAVSVRIAIASVIAFLIGEYQDVISFFFFRKLWDGKKFWLRSQIASLWSQLLDSAIFMTIAFYGVYDNHTLLNIIISWWLFKVAMGILYTPLLYVGLWLLRDKETASA